MINSNLQSKMRRMTFFLYFYYFSEIAVARTASLLAITFLFLLIRSQTKEHVEC